MARAESASSWTLGTKLDALTLAGAQHFGGTGHVLADVAAGDKGAVRLWGGIGESFAAVQPLRQADGSANDALAGTRPFRSGPATACRRQA